MATRRIIDDNGLLHIMDDRGTEELHDIKGMITPVKCLHCGKVYDLATVKVNHRFGDCDQFTTPCCDYKFADTREWKSFKDFERL